MRKPALVILLRVAVLVALAASAALYVDYQHAGDPAFCGVGSGCLAVRLSPYSKLGPFTLPSLGLAAFAGLFVYALVARRRAHLQTLALLAGSGGVLAVALLVVQGVLIKAWCKWCILADLSAITAALSALLLYRATKTDADEAEVAAATRPVPVNAAWVVAALGAMGLPFVWGEYPVIPPLPAPIAALQTPGVVTIVSFTDFECPFCRALHPTMHELLEQHAGQVVMLRRMMPLAGHPGAIPGAFAYTCTPPEKREAMATALYNAPPMLLKREGTIGIAEGLGLDRAAFTACIDKPETRAEVEKDIALFKQLDVKALPLTFIGPRVIMGHNEARVREAVALALGPARPELPVGAMFAAIGTLVAIAAALTARAPRPVITPTPAPTPAPEPAPAPPPDAA